MIDNLIAAMRSCDTADEVNVVLSAHFETGRFLVVFVEKGFAGLKEEGMVVVETCQEKGNVTPEDFDALILSGEGIVRYSKGDGLEKMRQFCLDAMSEQNDEN